MLLMGKSTISMVMFNSYVKLPEGNNYESMNVYVQFVVSSLSRILCRLSLTRLESIEGPWSIWVGSDGGWQGWQGWQRLTFRAWDVDLERFVGPDRLC